MSEKTTKEGKKQGTPWTIKATCRTYEQAFAEVQQLLNSGQKYETKIKRRSNGTFVVKTRLIKDEKRRS